MGQAELPPSVLFGETEMELWPYRRRTVALLRRYARASVEVGRLPSLLGREFFRTRVTSYTMRNFEDVVIFVADMEKAIERLNALEKKLLAMNVIEEYTIPEVARDCSVVTREWSSGLSRMHSISSRGSCLRAV
jgi:DNA-directed RNA polymerase specialized sigma24 family protein